MDCGGVFVKYVLFIFNFLFVICGILLIVFGSLLIANIGDLNSFSDTIHTNSIPVAILVLGCVIFIISFLGCCGAIRENSCCTTTYSVFMFLLFGCQLALVIFVWTQRVNILNEMDKVVSKIWEQRKQSPTVMDALQISFKCCGKTSFLNYLTYELPYSCCGADAKSCTTLEAMKKPGCQNAVAKFWEKNTDIIRYAGLAVAAVELVAFIFACCLANQVRNDRRRANY